MKADTLSKLLLIGLLVLIIFWSFSENIDGFQVNMNPNDPFILAMNLLETVDRTPPEWVTEAQIAKSNSVKPRFHNYMQTVMVPNGDPTVNMQIIIQMLTPILGPVYSASKAAGDSDSDTYDKIMTALETFLANQPRTPDNINTFFRNLPEIGNTYYKVLLMSVLSTPPPSWATPKQIADINKQITNFMGISVTSPNKSKTIFNNALSKAYTESKAAGDTDSVTVDKLIAAMRASLASGEIVSADAPEPTVVNPSWVANKNPISLSDLPNWVITGAHDSSWMSPTQIAQLSTLQAQADNIKNSPEKLGLLFGSIRTTYIVSKSHMQPDSHCLEQIISNSNLAINGNYNYVVPATELSSIKTWPSFTTATLASDLSEAISKVYATAGLPDIDKFYRINSLFYYKSMGHDPRGVGFGKHIPPPPKVTSSSLVPVGIQILCKLSDLAGYLKFLNGRGVPFLDETMTPAEYASRYPPSMIPPGLTAKIIDKSNGAIVWDPITTYVTNGTIAPFPNTTNVGTYIFYTNVGKIVPYEVPQKQSDRNAIDRILYNILDIFVTIDGTDKTSSLYGYLVNNLNISPELISASSFISSFQFQNIVYETYSTLSEDFTGSQNDSLQLDKLHYGDGTKLFPTLTVTSVLAYGSAIALFGGAVYYAMKQKIFKRFR